MHWFSDLPIRHKVVLVAMAGVIVALLAACTAFIIYDQTTLQRQLVRTLASDATMLGGNSTAALMFDDRAAATEILSALRIRPAVLDAIIYTPTGEVFAEFRQRADLTPPPAPVSSGEFIAAGTIIVVQPIVHNNERVGTILLRSSLDELDERLLRYLLTGVAVVLGSGALAFVLALRLQRVLSRPIESLAETAQQISAEKNYALRAVRTTGDELGQLTEEFNRMLAAIEVRDDELMRTRDQLEVRVAERTVALQEEIVERKQAQEALQEEMRKVEELSRLKDDFLSSTSHELRTPLTSILSAAKILVRYGERDPARMTKFAGIIHDEATRLTRLINDILDLAKIESGRIEWHMAPLDPAEMIAVATRAFEPAMQERGIAYTTTINAPLPRVYADRDRIHQVLTNLLSNAAKFTPAGGSVEVYAGETANGALIVKVRDSGPGIAPSDVHRIFDKFVQATVKNTDKPKGTGLGLALCKEILKGHHGEIKVVSTPGQGATFYFVIPPLAEGGQDARLAETPLTSSPSRG